MVVEGPNSVTYGSVSNHDVEHDASDMRIELTGSSMKSSSVGSMDYDNNRSQVDVCNGDNSVHRNLLDEGVVEANHKFVVSNSSNRAVWRRIAIQGSLVVNVVILLIKFIAYIRTLSLSVLAALVDSLLDVVSQVVLYFAERHAKENHSSAMYPAGASRMEPIGVLTCAALMGIASFEVLQESINSLFFGHEDIRYDSISGGGGVFSLILIVVTKLALLKVCNYAAGVDDFSKASISQDSTLAALALDHWNDAISNSVAVVALIASFASKSLWFFDPIGAILISLYIIHSWFSTGKEMIEQLIGKAAPEEFIDEIVEIASKHDSRMSVDVCRAYHFGPKFLAELEVVLPADMPLIQSHDIGMDLQYKIEGLEEVERCFVHIDYEKRDYDEHKVSKVPELRQKYVRKSSDSTSNGSKFSFSSQASHSDICASKMV